MRRGGFLPLFLALVLPQAWAMPEEPPQPIQVMAIPEPMRAEFRKQVLDGTFTPEQRLRKLVDFMFAPDGLALRYNANPTQTVAESYRSRQVNCLSFTLMAVALAREAGFKAQGQQISRVMGSGLVGDVVVQSLHVNAVVTLKDRNLMVKDGRDFVLDIASGNLRTQDGVVNRYKIDDTHLLAAFYGNRAMELLTASRLPEAHAWMSQALKLTPDDVTLWNNAGVLSQRSGDSVAAEKWFLGAARRDPDRASVLFNLVAMYVTRGDVTRAGIWQRRANRVLRRDPYYQFTLGERSAELGNFDEAVDHYKRAISLDNGEQLFHFRLARAYVQMGRLRDADRELWIAERLSRGPTQLSYQRKLVALRRLAY